MDNELNATELHKSKRFIKGMIHEACETRDERWLDVIAAAVHELDLELLEAYWQLDQQRRGLQLKAHTVAAASQMIA
jgi:hypothetical protein